MITTGRYRVSRYLEDTIMLKNQELEVVDSAPIGTSHDKPESKFNPKSI